MFHDKLMHGAATERKRQRRKLMLSGARKINLWQHLPKPVLGTTDDDWKAVGDDLRRAMTQQALCD